MSVAAARAYQFIRKAVLSGEFAPGSRLLETEVALMAGVSRTPVREAFRRLDSEGLVEMRPRLGAMVRSWSLDEVEDIFTLRALLEAQAAERAATRIGAVKLAELSDLANQMAALGQVGGDLERERIASLNSRFHWLLVEAAGSPRLKLMMAQVADVPLSFRTINRYDGAALIRSTQHHVEIVAALKRRDPLWAASVMRSHILAAWRAIEADARKPPAGGKR